MVWVMAANASHPWVRRDSSEAGSTESSLGPSPSATVPTRKPLDFSVYSRCGSRITQQNARRARKEASTL
jgi:hypothetical protein